MSTSTATVERLREYEIVFVLAPSADHAEAERINAKVSEVITSFGGKLTKLDNWGRRKLAYPIQKNTRGLFVYAKYVARPGVVAEIERNLRIADSVLRFQSTLLNPAVDVASVAVDPEDLTFAPVTPAEPEEEMNLEQRLGLVPSQRRVHTHDDEQVDEDTDDDEGNGAEGSEGGDE